MFKYDVTKDNFTTISLFFRLIFEIQMFSSLQYNIQYLSPAAWSSSYLNVDPRPQ